MFAEDLKICAGTYIFFYDDPKIYRTSTIRGPIHSLIYSVNTAKLTTSILLMLVNIRQQPSGCLSFQCQLQKELFMSATTVSSKNAALHKSLGANIHTVRTKFCIHIHVGCCCGGKLVGLNIGIICIGLYAKYLVLFLNRDFQQNEVVHLFVASTCTRPNIARVRNCPDITMLNPLVVFLSFH